MRLRCFGRYLYKLGAALSIKPFVNGTTVSTKYYRTFIKNFLVILLMKFFSDSFIEKNPFINPFEQLY